MTLQEYLKYKTAFLERAEIDDAENEAWICLMTATDMSRSELRFSMGEELEDCLRPSTISKLETIFARRANHEPLAYIVGLAPFYNLEFSVGPGVLIPRFDTETLVETALAALGHEVMLAGAPDVPQVRTAEEGLSGELTDGFSADSEDDSKGDSEGIDAGNIVTNIEITGISDAVRIFDLCTGSGCVGITIAHELQERGVPFELIMTDISPEASAFAKENAARILGDSDWKVMRADLWPDGDEAAWKADLIVANPPYITKAEMDELSEEVRECEPELALTDGGDGLALYRRIAADLPKYLKTGGVLAVEHGCDQGVAVRELLGTVLASPMTIQDYGGNDRVTCGRREA